MDPSEQNDSQGRTREAEPKRLVEKDFSLGYEKSSRFEAVTNFKISVAGYVSEEDHGLLVGYILNAHLERFGNDDVQQNHQKYVFLCATIHFLAECSNFVSFTPSKENFPFVIFWVLKWLSRHPGLTVGR